MAGEEGLLAAFKRQIEDAVAMVPEMVAEEKLRAVHFWNVVSERLQDIVNNSVADLNALALEMEKDKLPPYLSLTGQPASLPLPNPTPPPLLSLPQVTSPPPVPPSNSIAPTSQVPTNILSTLLTQGRPQQAEYGSRNEMVAGKILANVVVKKDPLQSEQQAQQPEELMTPSIEGAAATGTVDCGVPVKNELVDERAHKSKGKGAKKAQRPSPSIKSSQKVSVQKKGGIGKGKKAPVKKYEEAVNSAAGVISSNTKENVKHEEMENSYMEQNALQTVMVKELDNDQVTNDTLHLMISSDFPNEANGDVEKENGASESAADGVHECEYCQRLFSSETSLSAHLWTHTKPYVCPDCKARFSTKGNLVVHRRRHTGEKPFPCLQCDARFTTKGNLKRHVKAHSGEKPWECPQCSGRFTEKKSLKVHMRRHTGEKPYQCCLCSKRFVQSGILQTHMAMHLGQKAHLCDLCGKAFRQKSQLRLHLQRHAGVRKFICLHCSASFLTKGDMERHTRIHTGERPFVCDLCGASFTRQQSLNEHTNRHYGLKPYKCKHCGKGFAEMSACYKHIKNHERSQSGSTGGTDSQTEDDGSLMLVCDTPNSGDASETSKSSDKFPVLEASQTPNVENEMVVDTSTPHSGFQSPTSQPEIPTLQQPHNVQTQSQTVTHEAISIPEASSDLTAMNILASASTFQQTY